jgi:hypothetical protein
MLYISYLLLIPLAANFIADRSGVMVKLKWWLFYKMYSRKTRYKDYRLKPFDCTMCLSFWIAFIQLITYWDIKYILLPFATATVGALIEKL